MAIAALRVGLGVSAHVSWWRPRRAGRSNSRTAADRPGGAGFGTRRGPEPSWRNIVASPGGVKPQDAIANPHTQPSEDDATKLRGTLLTESLRLGAVLAVPDFVVTQGGRQSRRATRGNAPHPDRPYPCRCHRQLGLPVRER